MEIELMFSDLQSFGGPDKFQQSSSLKEISDKKLEFKSVSTKKYQLKQIVNGIFEYVPIVFEEQHFSISLCTVHSTLLDFSYKDPAHKTSGEGILQNTAT